MLFLSYAKADQLVAAEVASWLAQQGIETFNWLAPEQRGKLFMREIQEAMGRADDFLALVSPSYMASRWCRREADLALQIEQHMQSTEPNAMFVHVLLVKSTPVPDLGFLASYDWVDLAEESDVASAMARMRDRLNSLTERRTRLTESFASHLLATTATGLSPLTEADAVLDRLGLADEEADYQSSPTTELDEAPIFRNREQEIEQLVHALTVTGGHDFWLVTAPPQLGKSWFLKRIQDDKALDGWAVTLVELREEPLQLRTDVAALLARLFNIPKPQNIEQETRRSIAQALGRSRTSHLCMLDSAELLDRPTARTLRSCLSEIYRLAKISIPGGRLRVIIASRRDNDWRGVTPDPRLSELSLTEFTSEVIYESLADLERKMLNGVNRTDLRPVVSLVYAATEGLPALLADCLRWVQNEHWVDLDRLAMQEQFDELAGPYIKRSLLSRESIFPGPRGPEESAADSDVDLQLQAVKLAFRALSPYRLFTQAHLRYYQENDREFSDALDAANWSLEDLWNAISGSALLLRPLDEPWQKIYPAVRRLLYHYLYQSNAQRTAANAEACRFVEVWGEHLGKEQIVGLVECLWHHAIALRPGARDEFEASLVAYAAQLSRDLKPSLPYTVTELRDYASQRMQADEELARVCGQTNDFFNTLVETVRTPPDNGGSP